MKPTVKTEEEKGKTVKDFKWRCGSCKKRVYPDEYLSNLHCPHCKKYGLERHAKKGEWVLTL